LSIALARKYRPKTFADVAVQSHVSTTLKGAIARGRVAHGYLLCGPRGVGKTTLARVLAMALNCENKRDDGEPCGVCASCQRIWSGGASLDVVEIDAASNRGVDDARDLRERAMYAPSGDERYKVYIVDEAHMLTREAWNALLKILEEPPPRVVFVFATTEPQKIAQAAAPVLSRLQRFDFKRIGPAEVRERLAHVLEQEQVTSDADALAMIARAADGSMRDALSLTDQVLSLGDGRLTADRVRDALGLVPEDEFLALLDVIAERRAGEIFPHVARLADAGIDFGLFLTGFADTLRAQLAVELGGTTADVSEHMRRALEERRGRLSAADLLRMLSAFTQLEPQFRKSGQQQLLVETLLVRFALLDRSVQLEEVLRSLSEGGGSGGMERSSREPARTIARPSLEPRRGTASGPSTGPDDVPVARDVAAQSSVTPAPVEPVGGRPLGARPIGVRTTQPLVHAPGSDVAPQAPIDASAAPDTARPSGTPVDANKLTEQWDDVVDDLRRAGKTLLAAAMQHAAPSAVTARGDVTILLDEPNEFYAQAFESGRADLLGALRSRFPSVERVQLMRDENAPAEPKKRLTAEMIKAERLSALRKRDPVLGAAIDALDLDPLD
jgi:DNA polymerase III subunit gamma/tau